MLYAMCVCLSACVRMCVLIGVNPEGWGHDPQILGWGIVGVAEQLQGVVNRSRNIIIAHIAQKVCWKVVLFEEGELLSVGQT